MVICRIALAACDAGVAVFLRVLSSGQFELAEVSLVESTVQRELWWAPFPSAFRAGKMLLLLVHFRMEGLFQARMVKSHAHTLGWFVAKTFSHKCTPKHMLSKLAAILIGISTTLRLIPNPLASPPQNKRRYLVGTRIQLLTLHGIGFTSESVTDPQNFSDPFRQPASGFLYLQMT